MCAYGIRIWRFWNGC